MSSIEKDNIDANSAEISASTASSSTSSCPAMVEGSSNSFLLGPRYTVHEYALQNELGSRRRYSNKKMHLFAKGIRPNQKDVRGHRGCVNAVEFSGSQDILVSGGDDTRVFIWNVSDLMMSAEPKPARQMETMHASNIFAYAFANNDHNVYSGGNDGILICHDVDSGKKVFLRRENLDPIYNITVNPVDGNIVALARNSGAINFHDVREEFKCVMKISPTSEDDDSLSVYSGQYNPSHPYMFVVASAEGALLYDLRNNTKRLPFPNLTKFTAEGCLYAQFNPLGTGIAALRSGKKPIYYDLACDKAWSFFDKHYQNVHTIKSLDFIDDYTFVTGSDDFGIYAWNVPYPDGVDNPIDGTESDEHDKSFRSDSTVYAGVGITLARKCATARLLGHRSIVNHVRYSEKNKMLVSCGVEKIVKLWSPMELNGSYSEPNLRAPSNLRRLIEEDDEEPEDETAEDISMLRYFDRLVLGTRSSQQMVMNVGDNLIPFNFDSDMSDSDEDDESGAGSYLRRVLMGAFRAHVAESLFDSSDFSSNEGDNGEDNNDDVLMSSSDEEGPDENDEESRDAHGSSSSQRNEANERRSRRSRRRIRLSDDESDENTEREKRRRRWNELVTNSNEDHGESSTAQREDDNEGEEGDAVTAWPPPSSSNDGIEEPGKSGEAEK